MTRPQFMRHHAIVSMVTGSPRLACKSPLACLNTWFMMVMTAIDVKMQKTK
jgi:hypothetical protein